MIAAKSFYLAPYRAGGWLGRHNQPLVDKLLAVRQLHYPANNGFCYAHALAMQAVPHAQTKAFADAMTNDDTDSRMACLGAGCVSVSTTRKLSLLVLPEDMAHELLRRLRTQVSSLNEGWLRPRHGEVYHLELQPHDRDFGRIYWHANQIHLAL